MQNQRTNGITKITQHEFEKVLNVLVDDKTIKIHPEEFILTHRGYVKSNDLKLGDRIRAYHFCHLPQTV